MEIPLALGIIFGLIWSRRTGWNCGGLLTPGILAIHANMPVSCLCSLLVGVLLAPVLELIVRRRGLYGRERVGASMLLALAARYLWAYLFPSFGIAFPLWLGWVVPGLIAADIQHQGLCITLAGAVSTAISAAFASSLAVASWTFLATML
ncbi:MAG: poly-gamma-glutamate biosynthesis protein PgsC/CapC [Synergistaceae bacterium]|nr:poly-gamma-glutamate biosynthesis protein PgsC/CapC [Synergistaceae bacterium]